MGRIVQALEAKIEDGQSSIILTNQLSEFLKIFVKEDQRGITKADFSGGLHLGDIVMKLRRKGFCIHTDMEPNTGEYGGCLLYTSPSPRDKRQSRMPSSA